jgi:hypothetical protein
LNNSPPLSILVDSGAPNLIVDRARSDQVGLRTFGDVPQPGFGSQDPTPALSSLVNRIDLGGLILENIPSYSVPLNFFEVLIGHKTDAILGSDLFSRYVVEVDYLGLLLRLYDPDSYSDSGEGCQLPLSLATYATVHGQIETTNGNLIDAVLNLDTGSNYSIITKLFGDSHPTLPLNGKTIEAPTRRLLSGTTKIRIGRVRTIRLGACVVDEPIVAWSEDVRGIGAGGGGFEGTIGTNIFQQFTTIFDYRRHIVTFKRNSNPGGPLEYDMSGIHVLASGPEFHDFTIDQVMPNSPAEKKGIRPGDKIESVNRAPASQLTVDDLEKLFRRRGCLRLKIRRDGKQLKAKLKLKALI